MASRDKGKKKKKTGGMSGSNAVRVAQLISNKQFKQVEKLAADGVPEAVEFVQRRKAAKTKEK